MRQQQLSLLDVRTAWGLGFKKELKKRKASLDQYSSLDDGLKYYDQAVGSGEMAEKGKKVKVHFDCMYKGIDVVSSRQARLLGGNRTISEPIEFVAGGQVAGAAVKKITDTAGGLFAGTGGPKPPPALSSAVLGMKTGGKRSIIVPPELGYGKEGLQEIPPNGTFELEIELLSVG
ncbi:g1138 [Coccomyxa viridis]|uniref:peptidylprolyl isomerase n=1 Tax=Coccomyxa viridis TaxID=1274662 RepID=A0ABP1FP58_9CHLO